MASPAGATKQPFIEHVHELRKRLLISVAFILLSTGVGYAISDRLVDWLKAPLHQTLYYTSPTGAFSFIFKMSLFFGIVVSLPVILYQIVRFLEPLITKLTRRYVAIMLTASVLLAAVGIALAYYVSLPNALHFLTTFHSQDVKSLITADEYFNFVLAYLLGSALLFQVPLLMLVINRITPLKPLELMKIERYVIVGAFIIGAVLTPTPDPVNQALMSVPIIIMYQFGVGLVWLANRKSLPKPLPQAVPDMQLPDSLLENQFELDEPFEPFEAVSDAKLNTLAPQPVAPLHQGGQRFLSDIYPVKPARQGRHQLPEIMQRSQPTIERSRFVSRAVNYAQPNRALISDML